MIYIDFETYSEAPLKQCGAWVYATHPSTEPMCLAYTFDNDEKIHLWTPTDPPPAELFAELQLGKPVEAHNAFFEKCIWYHVMVKHYNWPKIHPSQWRCSAAKAASFSLPRQLEKACRALGITMQKDMAGHRVMMKLCKPQPKAVVQNGETKTIYVRVKGPELLPDLYHYCQQDVRSERALSQALKDLPQREQDIWFLDQKINARGVCIDTEAVEAALFILKEFNTQLQKDIKSLTKGSVTSLYQRDRILEWIAEQGKQMPSLTKQDVQSLLKEPDLPKSISEMLHIRKNGSRISTKKYLAMQQSVSKDHRIRDTLMYHGANTGRWTGKLVQLQNIPRGVIKDTEECIEIMKEKNLDTFRFYYEDVMGAISSCIRGMIVSAPGKDLIVADYNAIEARVLVWLANDQHGIKLFAEGQDPYVDMAKQIYHTHLITKEQRQLGKQAILGCGYGMGWLRFIDTCATYGIEIDEKMSKAVVDLYRQRYSTVRNHWYDQERAAILALTTGEIVKCGKVKWGYFKQRLYCRLPSGRNLAYNYPRLVKPEEKKLHKDKPTLEYMAMTQRGWETTRTYGGKLVENITQAVARDLLADAMIRCEKKGYPIIFSVHDELVSEVPEGFGSVKEFERLLTDSSDWAQGCPIKAEGWRGKRYKK